MAGRNQKTAINKTGLRGNHEAFTNLRPNVAARGYLRYSSVAPTRGRPPTGRFPPDDERGGV